MDKSLLHELVAAKQQLDDAKADYELLAGKFINAMRKDQTSTVNSKHVNITLVDADSNNVSVVGDRDEFIKIVNSLPSPFRGKVKRHIRQSRSKYNYLKFTWKAQEQDVQ